jgi:hypothetical protein
MPTNPETPKKTLDERLDALTHNVELLAAMQKHSIRSIKRLTKESRKHEADNALFHRIMRAALTEYLDAANGNEDNR